MNNTSYTQEENIIKLIKFIDSGLAYIKEKGISEACKEFSNPNGKFIAGELYLFAIKNNGDMLAHGGDPQKMLGTNITGLRDKFNTSLLDMFVAAAKSGGGIACYYWPDYTKGNAIRFKITYIKPIDNDTFIGAGCYGD